MTARLWLEQRRSHHQQIVTSQLRTSGRPYLLLHYQCESAHLRGEASPLIGFGRDDLDEAARDLSTVDVLALEEGANRLVRFYREVGCCAQSSIWESLTDLFSTTSPSARFCWEMLCARLASHRLTLNLFELLGAPVDRTLLTSCVLDPLGDRVFDVARSFVRQGVRTFKLKCGRDLESELSVLGEIRKIPRELGLSSSVCLRLDLNCALGHRAARSFLSRLDPNEIQWVEDPTGETRSWSELSQAGIRLAMDEPLSTCSLGEAETRATACDVLILKPMALGGFSACFRLAQWAKSEGKTICVSHFFDGPLSFEATAALAFAVQSPSVAVGLSAHAGLAGDAGAAPALAEFSWLLSDRMIVPINP